MPPDFDKTCFVIMPIGPEGSEFREQSDDTYDTIIKAAVKNADIGLRCVRSDEITRSGNIIDQVIRYCVRSRFVIADLTRRNPNVFYELGIRHSWANRTILMASDETDLPFDVNPMRTILYSKSTQRKVAEARRLLTEYLVDMNSDVLDTDSPVLQLFSRDNAKRTSLESVVDPAPTRNLNRQVQLASRIRLLLQFGKLTEYENNELPKEFDYYMPRGSNTSGGWLPHEITAIYKANVEEDYVREALVHTLLVCGTFIEPNDAIDLHVVFPVNDLIVNVADLRRKSSEIVRENYKHDVDDSGCVVISLPAGDFKQEGRLLTIRTSVFDTVEIGQLEQKVGLRS